MLVNSQNSRVSKLWPSLNKLSNEVRSGSEKKMLTIIIIMGLKSVSASKDVIGHPMQGVVEKL